MIYDKLRAQLVLFKYRNDDKKEVYKMANFMIVDVGTNKSFIMPIPMSFNFSRQAGKFDPNTWIEIHGIQIMEGKTPVGIPFGGFATQYFGDI